jgi:hypothetical protein
LTLAVLGGLAMVENTPAYLSFFAPTRGVPARRPGRFAGAAPRQVQDIRPRGKFSVCLSVNPIPEAYLSKE